MNKSFDERNLAKSRRACERMAEEAASAKGLTERERHREAMEYDPESVYAESSHRDLMDEIADTIQACCNLAAALGVTDLTPFLARCEERNRGRGRYDE